MDSGKHGSTYYAVSGSSYTVTGSVATLPVTGSDWMEQLSGLRVLCESAVYDAKADYIVVCVTDVDLHPAAVSSLMHARWLLHERNRRGFVCVVTRRRDTIKTLLSAFAGSLSDIPLYLTEDRARRMIRAHRERYTPPVYDESLTEAA